MSEAPGRPDRGGTPVRVLIADDQALIRAGFRALLDRAPDIEVVGEAVDGADALAQARLLHPDVVLMDVRMPVLDGIAATERLAADPALAGTRVIVVTTYELDEYIHRALRAGASGFLLKDLESEELRRAVRVVARGEALLAPSVTRRLISEFTRRAPGAEPGLRRRVAGLSAREREVLTLVGRGLSNEEIAAELVISPAVAARTCRLSGIVKRTAKAAGIAVAALAVLVTAASFGYNLATSGPAPRPAHLLFAKGGGWDTRYLEWGTHGTPVVLVPGAFETADTFGRLGPVLAEDHRVFAIDLSGTGYSAPNPPFSADHLASQLLAFIAAEGLTGPSAPVLVGHSAGAADVGVAALRDPAAVRGVVFLDGDATPLHAPAFLGAVASTLFINPYKTSVLRLALSQDWLIRNIYNSMCGPTCPALNEAGLNAWRWPLEQPGFQAEVTYSMRNGITAMTPAQFSALKAADVPKLVVAGVHDPQMAHSDMVATAQRIGAPAPVYVPGRHLTMIASPRQVAAAIDSLGSR